MEGGARRDGCGGPQGTLLQSRRAARAIRLIAGGTALAAAAVAVVDCSLWLDWNDFTNGDAGSPVGADASNGADGGDGVGVDATSGMDAGEAAAPDGGDVRCVPALSDQLRKKIRKLRKVRKKLTEKEKK